VTGVARLWSILTFRGEVGRWPYVVAAVATLIVQHLALQAAIQLFASGPAGWATHFSLFLVAATGARADVGRFLLAYALINILSTWWLGALTFCRARQAGAGFALTTLVVVPLIQLGVIAFMARLPAASSRDQPVGQWIPAAQGVLAAAVLCVFAVAVGALGFGVYGVAMFMFTPVLIGLVTGYLANRSGDIGGWQTMTLTIGALWLGALSLLSLALEGVVCLVLATPLVAPLAIGGCLAGRALAVSARRPARDAMAAFVLLPLAFAAERTVPATNRIQLSDSVVVAAPPSRVWQAVTHMGAIEAQPSLPFRLGLAYPTAGVIHGEGVGAIREGHFSTGVAYERVSEWAPGRRLTFDVLSDAPSMAELSPYAHVNAPHVVGYFRTRTARFDLTPLPDGRTRLTLTTTHELDLNPAFYWTPIAEWATRQNKARVLAHFKRLAEGRALP
jgi:hypothetical protein